MVSDFFGVNHEDDYTSAIARTGTHLDAPPPPQLRVLLTLNLKRPILMHKNIFQGKFLPFHFAFKSVYSKIDCFLRKSYSSRVFEQKALRLDAPIYIDIRTATAPTPASARTRTRQETWRRFFHLLSHEPDLR